MDETVDFILNAMSSVKKLKVYLFTLFWAKTLAQNRVNIKNQTGKT